jgi:hypothetical protein
MRPFARTERRATETLHSPDISVVPEEKPKALEPSEPVGEGHEPPAP